MKKLREQESALFAQLAFLREKYARLFAQVEGLFAQGAKLAALEDVFAAAISEELLSEIFTRNPCHEHS